MYSVEMLPARQGDCLWIEYGDTRNPYVVLIDGGMTETAAAIRGKLRQRTPRIELLVITHIDNDHILGVLDLLQNPELDIGDIWFNGRPQLDLTFSNSDLLGVAQGDALSKLLEGRKRTWNRAFHGELAVVTDEPRQVELAGGMRITLIGPPRKRLAALAAAWLDLKEGRSDPSETDALGAGDDVLGKTDTWPANWCDVKKLDTAVANGSSIALVAEFDQKRLLLTGDAFAPDLVDGLRSYREYFARDEPEPIRFAAVKLSHHGSVYNISRELIEQIRCKTYLVSTDGTQHKHPDTQALLRLVCWCAETPTMCFNYRKERTVWWSDRRNELDQKFRNYETRSPELEQNGWLRLVL